MKKTRTFFAGILAGMIFSGGILAAQENTKKSADGAEKLQNEQKELNEEEIELPDVTTVISGGAFTAGKDAVPDYRKILPETDSPKVQLPVLGDAKAAGTVSQDKIYSQQDGKDIYAEGQLGAGYPFYFTGDFSVYRASGNSPFSIKFAHEGAEGFAGKKASDGYFERVTGVSGTKSFYGEKSRHDFSAEYKTSDDGLQLRSDYFTDIVKHTVSADYRSELNFSSGVFVDFGSGASWFKRYGQHNSDDGSAPDNYLSKNSILSLDPSAGFGWRGKGFEVALNVLYGGQYDLENSGTLIESEDGSHIEYSHRGQFGLKGSWKNDFLGVFAKGALVVGTQTGSREVVPSFGIGASVDFESFVDSRKGSFAAEGGIDSWQAKLQELENTYRHAVLGAIPTESTDFYGKASFLLPVVSGLEVLARAEFRKTAFDNGIWEADYSTGLNGTAGIGVLDDSGAVLSGKARTDFNSEIGISFDRNSFKMSGGFRGYFKDVPVLCDRYNIFATAIYQPEDTKWNAGLSSRFGFGGDADNCPELSGWAGVKLAPALSVAFRLNDSIKLFSKKSRKYAHSDFVQKSGSAVLLVKFQF